MNQQTIPALSFNDADFISAFRALASMWNAGAGDAAALAPMVDAFEAEAVRRGMDLKVILKGC